MAGDWIKLEVSTPDKPEIVLMASILNIDQDAVFGKCCRLWIWADQQTVSGDEMKFTASFIDRLTFCPGFAAALRQVGWLSGRDGLLTIPNFDRHNGQTAKKRAQTKDRVERMRTKDCNASSVTEALPEKRREREEKIETQETHKPPASVRGESSIRFRPPTLDEVSEFVRSAELQIDAAEFVDFYTSKGWKVGSSAMKDWQSAARNWHRKRVADDNNKPPAGRGAASGRRNREAANADAFAVLSEAIAAEP
ncbi:MAG: hypothetical protein JNL58_08140 [Planctomyces sp.]|nr:hypothetical protein [Planctomyces sp.]